MRIVDLSTFLKLPEGTVYQKYKPQYFEDLQVKAQSLGTNDFIYADLTGNIENDSSEDFSDKVRLMEKNPELSLELDFDCYARDGFFDVDQLFAIWEKQDIEGLIDKLNHCLTEAYN